MYGTIGAIFLAGSTMVGLAIGPYVTGKVATLTGSLETGVLSMLLMPPIALFALWRMSRKVEWAETTKVARARAAGEAQA
jgi:MFS-type transporter involved in bile tolerance (Atg22 family)